jgi:hypothetical protein
MIDHIDNEKKLLASKLILELQSPTLQNKKKISKDYSLNNSQSLSSSQNTTIKNG